MDIRTTPEVEYLFAAYERYSQESDYRAIAKLFSTRVVLADPKRIVFKLNNLFTRWRFVNTISAFYKDAGLKTISILRLSEYKISDQFSLANVTWAATFTKTNSLPFEFHVTYLLKKRKGKARIVMIMAHEDERKVLEGYGVIS